MKLWEIKAQSLRLMFTDTDMFYEKEDFEDGTLMNNYNTREKLIMMTASIKRGIDLFYNTVGEYTSFGTFKLKKTMDVISNEIDISQNTLFGEPTRIDVNIFSIDEKGNKEIIKKVKNVEYFYDNINKKIFPLEVDYTSYQEVSFSIWYKTKKVNIPSEISEIEYDLNDIYIPEEVQRALPFYVKSELFEEDEPQIAQKSRNEFLQVLYGVKKPFSNVQTRVRRSPIFEQRS